MNVKLKVLRKVLEEAIDNIDAGNSNHSDDELDDIISSLTKLNRGIKRISKREACERILHCSPSSFDNYIKLGLIPRGHKEYGFKELSWSEKDFDKATLARIKKYRDKQCADFVELVNGMWQKAYDAQKARQDDRNVLNAELFSIYSAMRNGFDAINAKHNEDAFNLYKYSRDSKDELSSEIGELRTELAVLKATRPYQDALIQCDIRRVAEHADFNLWRRTCRMISGEVVLPNTPVIEGYASYNPCHIQSTTPAPAA